MVLCGTSRDSTYRACDFIFTEVDLKLSYTHRLAPFCVPGLKSWFWQYHCVQNHRVTNENCWQMFDLTKTFVWKMFWKKFTSENRPKSAKKEGKNFWTFFELFLNFFPNNDMFSECSPDPGLSNPSFRFSISGVFMKIF